MKLALALTAFMAGFGSPAIAQNQNCAPYGNVLDQLLEKWGETRISVGIASNGYMIETFTNEDNGTFTITYTTPQGMTCLVASGENFETVIEPRKPNL